MVRNDLIGTGLGKDLTLFRMEKGREKWGDLPFFTSTSQHTEGFYHKLGFHTVEHIPNGFPPPASTPARCGLISYRGRWKPDKDIYSPEADQITTSRDRRMVQYLTGNA